MPEFIPGLALNEAFFQEAVRPILGTHFPRLPYSAALIGPGSDVLGLDTPISTDHGWGPRLLIFLRPEDMGTTQEDVYQALRWHLPVSFRGYTTHFGAPDPRDSGVRPHLELSEGPVDPLIDIHTIASYWQNSLGLDPFRELTPADWVTLPEQRLLEVTAGKVFHDNLGLEPVRARFRYYPRDVWYYLLAAQWALISQEEAFVGRTAQVGDALGSRLVAARQVDRLMHLCFLMEKRYAPYSKWLGTAFRRLPSARRMLPLLEAVLAAQDYPEREKPLAQAYSLAAEMHNDLRITPPLDTQTRTYSGWHALREEVEDLPLEHPRNTRPHQVIFAGRIANAIQQAIQDPAVLTLPPYRGSAGQFLVESSDALQDVAFCHSLKPSEAG